MELDLQSLFGLHVYSCTHWLRPGNSPPHPPAFGLIYAGAYWSHKIDDGRYEERQDEPGGYKEMSILADQ
jgi:hypothetical protein